MRILVSLNDIVDGLKDSSSDSVILKEASDRQEVKQTPELNGEQIQTRHQKFLGYLPVKERLGAHKLLNRQIRPSISVIIPVYNGRKYLKEAIESVARQTLLPVELIIVDDGSSDDSLSILKDMELPFPVIEIFQENGGQGTARNHGARLAKGTYLAFLDQDDRWYPEHLEKLVKPFSKMRRIGWVYSNLDEIDRQGQLVSTSMLNNLSSKHPKTNLIDLLSHDMFILPSASIISKEAFDSINGFDVRLRGYEDDDIFLRLFRKGYRNVYLPQALSQWRIYHSSSSFSARMAESRKIYAGKLVKTYPDDPGLARFWVRDCIAPRFLHNSLGDFFSGRAARNFDKCEAALGDILYYAKLTHKKTWVKLNVLVCMWRVRLELLRQYKACSKMLTQVFSSGLEPQSDEYEGAASAFSKN
jgi:glycosyltransferase involved in cell wall biosynthesis